MPELNSGNLSRRDKGITTAEICPNCRSTEIDVERAYQDGEPTGTRYRCLDCDWIQDFEDQGEAYSRLEKEVITVDAVTGWLEAFRETAVEELRQTNNLDQADQRHLQSEIQTLDQLIEFFNGGDQSNG